MYKFLCGHAFIYLGTYLGEEFPGQVLALCLTI